MTVFAKFRGPKHSACDDSGEVRSGSDSFLYDIEAEHSGRRHQLVLDISSTRTLKALLRQSLASDRSDPREIWSKFETVDPLRLPWVCAVRIRCTVSPRDARVHTIHHHRFSHPEDLTQSAQGGRETFELPLRAQHLPHPLSADQAPRMMQQPVSGISSFRAHNGRNDMWRLNLRATSDLSRTIRDCMRLGPESTRPTFLDRQPCRRPRCEDTRRSAQLEDHPTRTAYFSPYTQPCSLLRQRRVCVRTSLARTVTLRQGHARVLVVVMGTPGVTRMLGKPNHCHRPVPSPVLCCRDLELPSSGC